MNAGCSESVSCTSASKTGPEAKRKNPIIIRSGNMKLPLEEMNIHIKIGLIIEVTSSVFFLPNLSEIGPAKKVPIAPENCSTAREIPANNKLLP